MNPPPLGPFFLSWCQCCNIYTAIKTTAALGVCKAYTWSGCSLARGAAMELMTCDKRAVEMKQMQREMTSGRFRILVKMRDPVCTFKCKY